ncbi:unnamed protein product, partial [Callosobruchus maculatus]
MSRDLIVDPQIRSWVFLPLVVGILRHYASILLSSQKKVELQQLADSQFIIRARVLRENCSYIPQHSFLMETKRSTKKR